MILGLAKPIVLATVNINFFIGLPLNICVLVLLTRAGAPDGTLVFTLSQITSEILFAVPAPLFVLCHVNFEKLCFYHPLVFITGTCMTSRFLLQCCVSSERYMAVVHPVTFLKYKAMKYRAAISAGIWLYSVMSGFLTLFYLSALPFNVFGLVYAMFLGLMLFLSLSLLRGLSTPGPGSRERDDSGLSAAKKKAFKIVSVNLLIFLIQIVPLMVCFAMKYTLSQDAFAMAFMVSLNINIIISLFQPVLFLYQNGKLRCGRCGRVQTH